MPEPTRPPRASGQALEAMYRFLLWLIPAVEKFPRSQKFLLGDRIRTIALEVLERLIEATYSRSREPLLSQANLGLEKLQFLFRIARWTATSACASGTGTCCAPMCGATFPR